MAEMLSPGIFIEETDVSTIVPTVSNSIGVFGGQFAKGPVGTYKLITSVDELISNYGLPSNTNYNDFYQAWNFLQYGNKLYVSRAANTDGNKLPTGVTVNGAHEETNVISVSGLDITSSYVTFGAAEEVYYVVAKSGEVPVSFTITDITSDGSLATCVLLGHGLEDGLEITISSGAFVGTHTITVVDENSFTFATSVADTTTESSVSATYEEDSTITLDRNLAVSINDLDVINEFYQTTNGVFEAVKNTATSAVSNFYEYIASNVIINNIDDFETKFNDIAFVNSTDSKLKIISRNPGKWANKLDIAIATPSVFGKEIPTQAFEGIQLDALFEYAPTGSEVAIVIKEGDKIVETFLVSFDESAKDFNNKSLYIENVINTTSNYIYVKVNNVAGDIKDYCYSIEGTLEETIKLWLADDSDIQANDLISAYEVWENKEAVDIDIIIANEVDGGSSAHSLVSSREDCIAFIGAKYEDVVGKKASDAISNLLEWRKSGDLNNKSSMFNVACANYKYQYDRYNDVYRWVNIAGDIAGLRAQTSTNRASWWASAGIDRGQIKNAIKLAFNPTQGMRDILYKNSLNPICSFPGQGTVMYGQKTLLDKASSFDRVNTRGLFNTLERALGKMARYQVMEFNDSFTRNRIVSMIKPYLSSVKAGRGIDDFLVVCDTSNNTNDIISRNQLIVDIYIKPNYVAEFVNLRFTNAGTNSFSEIIG